MAELIIEVSVVLTFNGSNKHQRREGFSTGHGSSHVKSGGGGGGGGEACFTTVSNGYQ